MSVMNLIHRLLSCIVYFSFQYNSFVLIFVRFFIIFVSPRKNLVDPLASFWRS